MPKTRMLGRSKPVLNEVARYGTASVKRAFGDWTTPRLTPWKDRLNRFAIQPIQQFRYTSGKNASDSALIIDAMDLLHTGHFDAFCLVSSDSDFTRLACRLRESGITVYGFGERKTPEPFVQACDRFTFVEDLAPSDEQSPNGQMAIDQPSPGPGAAAVLDSEPEQVRLVRAAYAALAPEGGWVCLGALGGHILKLSPSFQPRRYGYRKLSALVAAVPECVLDDRASENDPDSKHFFVAMQPPAKPGPATLSDGIPGRPPAPLPARPCSPVREPPAVVSYGRHDVARGDRSMPPTLQELGIDRLSVEDRIALATAIWDSIAAAPIRRCSPTPCGRSYSAGWPITKPTPGTWFPASRSRRTCCPGCTAAEKEPTDEACS